MRSLLCGNGSDPADQTENAIAGQTTGGVQNQIIHIRCPGGKGQLNDLNGQGDQKTGADGFLQTVQMFVDQRGHDAGRDEHGKVADDVQQHTPPGIVVKEVDEGQKIDTERPDGGSFQNQRENTTVFCGHGVGDHSVDDHQIDQKQKLDGFLLPAEGFVFKICAQPKQHPTENNYRFGKEKRKLNHSGTALALNNQIIA